MLCKIVPGNDDKRINHCTVLSLASNYNFTALSPLSAHERKEAILAVKGEIQCESQVTHYL